MKEIVVIPKDDLVYIKPKYKKMERYIKEPETFEELKELCKEFGEIEILENNIYFRGMTFRLNGDVEDFEGNIIGENRTPQQMWQIIMGLLGEK